jgi:hypothetical protein
VAHHYGLVSTVHGQGGRVHSFSFAGEPQFVRIDRIFLKGTRKDFHFTRCCVASIRHWYPDIPIALVKDELFGRYDTSELERCWDVEVLKTRTKHFGQGMTTFEPLLLPTRERCLILDSDIVFVGPILESLEQYDEDFVVERSNYPLHDIKSYYFDPELMSSLYPSFRFPGYVFNCGQIVATTGILRQEFFTPFIAFDSPHRIIQPDVFVCFEQSVLNFVLQQKAQDGVLSIRRHDFLRWPPAMQPSDVELERLRQRLGYEFLMHWAGPKSSTLVDNPMSHVLKYFDDIYRKKIIAMKPDRRKKFWWFLRPRLS